MKKHVKTAFRFLVSGGLIARLVYTQDIAQIGAELRSFNLFYLVPAALSLLLGTYISSLRWGIAVKAVSKKKVTTWELYRLYLKGYFYNNFLPTGMGGDVYKSYALGKQINDQTSSAFSVLVDRLSGLLILLALSLFGIGNLFGKEGIVISLVVIIFGAVLYFPLLNIFSTKIKLIKRFKQTSDLFLKEKRKGLLVLFYALLVQLFSFSLVGILFYGLGIKIPLSIFLAFLPLASLAMLVPSINNFGTQETIYAFLFGNVGVGIAASISVSILIHVIRLFMSLLGGFLIFIKK